MSNAILSIKELLRMDFMQIFQNINGVEEALKLDPANVYTKMDYKTKETYRNEIKKLSTKTKISEIYIANKILELCNREGLNKKQKHVGYYLINKGKQELVSLLLGKEKKEIKKETKAKLYVLSVWGISIIISALISICIGKMASVGGAAIGEPLAPSRLFAKINLGLSLLFFILTLIPIQEIVIQIIRYILGKIVVPKPIPKIDIRKTK